jgi:hypothetical protein
MKVNISQWRIRRRDGALIMKEVFVTADTMATLLLTDPGMEKIPEPIRMQPTVRLVIDFSEYLDFCRAYLHRKDYLATPTAVIKRFLETADEGELVKCFYRDMAVAVCKELHFARLYRKQATLFYHTFENPTKVRTAADICAGVNQYSPAAEAFLYPYMTGRGFTFLAGRERENVFMGCYARVLGWSGMASPSRWVYEKNRAAGPYTNGRDGTGKE